MSDFKHLYQTIEFVNELLNKPGPIIINSGIYGYLYGDDDDLDATNDLIVVGTNGKKITFADIVGAFNHMKDQFDVVKDHGFGGRAYFFEGFKYNKREKSWDLLWGS